MKNILIIIVSFLFFNCSKDDESKIEQVQSPEVVEISDYVEVYNSSLFEDDFVFSVINGGTKSYLLNKQGFKVKEWTFDKNLGNDITILPDGKLLGMFRSNNVAYSFGGYGGVIRIINTDGSINWEYEISSNDYLAHHDLKQLPNGNIVCLVWERTPLSNAIQLGINATGDIFTEKIVEINPSSNQIVWQWRSIDHIIQDQMSTFPNYGSISQNPQLININYNNVANGDYMHANGIEYDAVKDVLFVSVNYFSEVWVIDHSTSTSEATSHLGGNYNKGGDLIYRFGNPETYGNIGQRLFYNNHCPVLIKESLPGGKNMLVYGNGSNVGQSTVYEFAIPNVFTLAANTNNEPAVVWSFTDVNLFSEKISNAVRLPNGNTLITEGDFGIWEVTVNKEVVWKYKEPGSYWRSYGYAKNSPEILSLGL